MLNIRATLLFKKNVHVATNERPRYHFIHTKQQQNRIIENISNCPALKIPIQQNIASWWYCHMRYFTFDQSDQWRMSIGAQEQYLYFAIGL